MVWTLDPDSGSVWTLVRTLTLTVVWTLDPDSGPVWTLVWSLVSVQSGPGPVDESMRVFFLFFFFSPADTKSFSLCGS